MASEASLVPEPQIKQITKQVLGKYNSIAAIATGPTIYLVAIITGLSGKQALQVIMYAVPVLVVLFAMIGPNVFLGRLVRRAFSVLPGDAPGERIGRLLRMPRQIEIFQTVWGGIGIGIYASICAAVSGQSWLTVPWAVAAVGLVSLLQGISVRLSIEKLLRPFAIAEFQKAPDVVLPGGGFTWPRQWWYLPYTFAVFVADTLMMAATIIGRQASNYYDLLMAELPKTAHNEVVTRVQETLFALARDTAIPLAVLGAYLLALAAFSAWLIAQHQSAGAKEVENAMAALAAGKPRLPNWIATDEVGDLAAASTRAFERLKKFSLSLGQS
ncbi:MAG TPA: hypothetical protein VK447_03970, partial [Myxococcaceae bacterium]|nr:hypothetical protein [Myxococcaceae bacterium]